MGKYLIIFFLIICFGCKSSDVTPKEKLKFNSVVELNNHFLETKSNRKVLDIKRTQFNEFMEMMEIGGGPIVPVSAYCLKSIHGNPFCTIGYDDRIFEMTFWEWEEFKNFTDFYYDGKAK